MRGEFEILATTSGENIEPVMEIRFKGQRLCLVRRQEDQSDALEFGLDHFVDSPVALVCSWQEFCDVVAIARSDLAAWIENLSNSASGRPDLN